MHVLVIFEQYGKNVRSASWPAIGFANDIVERTGGNVECLLLGIELEELAQEVSAYTPVLIADHVSLAHPTADRYAKVIADVSTQIKADLIVAASSTFSKDILGRTAGLLGGAMVSDVIEHELRDGQLVMRRPMFAGSVIATVLLKGEPKIVTIRSSAYKAPQPSNTHYEIKKVEIDETSLPSHIHFEGLDSKASNRPDVTEARVVVSGGRAFKNKEDFECLAGKLADRLGGAVGSSRALVDAGITANELQVGQTGKIVAPELYFALGISGAVQHLAGMKNSKVIVAINNDPDAPIFEFADYGLVGDVYQLIPQLIEKLNDA